MIWTLATTIPGMRSGTPIGRAAKAAATSATTSAIMTGDNWTRGRAAAMMSTRDCSDAAQETTGKSRFGQRGDETACRSSVLMEGGIRVRSREIVAEIVASFPWCYPLTELSVIRHEPDNRLLECPLAADAEFIVTVNTAPGHFDRKQYQAVSVARPGQFLNVPEIARLVKNLIRD